MTAIDHSNPHYPDDDAQHANLGEMLRHARELRELSVEDLARRLRLETRIIRQLETDQYDKLAAPAFIRGYIRSIAKELDIDSTPLVAIFDLRCGDAAPALSDFESRAPIQITADSNVIRYTTIFLVVIMIVMVALWWRSHDMLITDTEPVMGDEIELDTEPATTPLAYEFAIVTHPEGPDLRGDPTPPVDTADIPDAPDAPVATADRVAQAGPAADSGIVINANEDAWVEVRDGNGARLHYGFVYRGREQRFDGAPPYDLTIGNANAVTLRYRGQVVALEAFSNKGVARLQLGANAVVSDN